MVERNIRAAYAAGITGLGQSYDPEIDDGDNDDAMNTRGPQTTNRSGIRQIPKRWDRSQDTTIKSPMAVAFGSRGFKTENVYFRS